MKKLVLKIFVVLIIFLILSSCEGTHKVTFNYNCEGMSDYVCDINANNKIDCIVEQPTCKNYSFLGWYNSKDGENKVDLNSNFTNSITLYAKWDKENTTVGIKYYVMTFDLNGGDNLEISSMNVEYGAELSTLSISIPTREGYTFMGWYDNSDYTKGIKYYDASNSRVKKYDKDSNMTLYAGWSKNAAVRTDISAATISNINNQKFTGNVIIPEFTVILNGIELIKDKDYIANYVNNQNVGIATIMLTGIGSYKGSKTTTFEIEKISSTITCSNKTFNGNEQTIATCEGGTISNANQTNAGSYKVICKGDNNHNDAETKECTIFPMSISIATVSAVANQRFTGSAITPEVSVTLSGRELKRDADYKIGYSDNTNVGTATIKITGLGNYTGSKETKFTIIEASAPKTSAVITCSNKEYTGSSQIIAECSGGTISNANQTKVGTYKVTCKGDSNHTDAEAKNCKIEAADIEKSSISAITNQKYTGKQITPEFTVTLNKNKLSKDKDYKISYSDNTNAGTAKITITGIGSYKGSKTTTFKIEKISSTITCSNKTFNGNAQTIATCEGGTISNEKQTNAGNYKITCKGDNNHNDAETKECTISALDVKSSTFSTIASQKYTGNQIVPEFTVTLNKNKLSKDKDYKISYSNNTNVGTATIKITGIGNYKGSKTTTFKIEKIASTITCSNKTFNGIIQTIATCKGGTISNEKQTKAGSYKVTCKGDSNHTNASSKTCKISKANIESVTISQVANQKYTGSAITPSVTMIFNGISLIKGTDYKAGYSNNKNPGTATIKITGTGNYTGTITKTFIINPIITFSGNGSSSGTMEKQSVTYNEDTALSTNNFAKEGFAFAGWNTKKDGSGTSYKDKAKVKITKNITLYAQWKVEQKTITYYLGDGTSTAKATSIGNDICKVSSTCTIKTFESFNKEFPLSDNLWKFAGWTNEKESKTVKYSQNYKILYSDMKDLNLYAVGKRTFTFASGTSPKSILYTEIQYWNPYSTSTKYVTSITVPKPKEISGWTFIGYRANDVASSTVTIKATNVGSQYTAKPGSLSALNFRSIYQREVTVTFSGNGSTSGTMEKQTVMSYYNSGYPENGTNKGANYSTFKLNANEFKKNGSTFVGWNTQIDGNGTSYSDKAKISAKNNITLYAQWDEYKIAYNLNGGSNPSGVKTSYSKTDNTYVLPTPTKSNYAFAGWYETSNFSGLPITQISKGSTGNKTFYARWVNKNTFIVKYDCNGGTNPPKEEILTKGDLFVPAVNTCVKANKEFNAWLNAKNNDWTFTAISDYANGKYGITNNTIILKASWLNALTKNEQIKPSLQNYTKEANCKRILSTDNPKNIKNVYCEYGTSTLKYVVVKPDWNYSLTYVWVKDAYNQFKMALPDQMNSSTPSKRKAASASAIKNIVVNENKDKSFVAFNGSPMVSNRFYTDAPDEWKYGPAIQYLKYKGTVLRNSINSSNYWLSHYRYIAGMASDGTLKYYNLKMSSSDSNYTDAKKLENTRIIDYIEKNGIKDTFSWYKTYRNGTYESGEKFSSSDLPTGKGASRAICQVDLNNFIIVTPTFSDSDVNNDREQYGINLSQIIKSLNCDRALRIDGGGSTVLWAKEGNTVYGPGRTYDGRNSGDLLYFVEK